MRTSSSTRILLAAAITLVCSNLHAQDWSSCASDLDDLRRRADDASTVANETDQRQKRFKSAEDDFRQCRQYPQIYDLMRDRCQSKAYDLDFARSAYRSNLQSLRGSLDDVDSKIRSAASSCGFDLGRIFGPPPAIPPGVRNPEQCAVYIRYKGRIPQQALLDTCSKQLSVDECKKCLE